MATYRVYNHYTGEVLEFQALSKTQAKRRAIKFAWMSIDYDRNRGYTYPKMHMMFNGNCCDLLTAEQLHAAKRLKAKEAAK